MQPVLRTISAILLIVCSALTLTGCLCDNRSGSLSYQEYDYYTPNYPQPVYYAVNYYPHWRPHWQHHHWHPQPHHHHHSIPGYPIQPAKQQGIPNYPVQPMNLK